MVKKIKIVSLGRNLVPKLIWICRIHWWCSLFKFSTNNDFFGKRWFKKLSCQLKLSWILVPGFPLVREGGAGGLEGSPQLPKILACDPMSCNTLVQKYYFCNFYTVFCYFAQFPCHKFTPNGKPWVSEIIFIIFWDFSFHPKWSEARLLLINMVYSSCLRSCQAT